MGAKTAKRLLILIAVLLFGGVSIFFIQRFQVMRMAQSVLARAKRTEKEGDFSQAERLYREHLEVVPTDLDTQVKYADVLLKESRTPARQEQAFQIYSQILGQTPGRQDVRRRLAELAVDMKRYDSARTNLVILLKSTAGDGMLEFLMGRCQEAEGEDGAAATSYQAAIEHVLPSGWKLTRGCATLLRGRLNKPAEADQAIEAMVQSDPENYRVYLSGGRYRWRFRLEGATDDYQKALKQGPSEPQIFVELAGVAQDVGKFDEARRILENGLKAAPKEPSLHERLADLNVRTGRFDEAIAGLQRSLQILPEEGNLHCLLANLLAERGNTADLYLQIEELKRIGYAPILIGYLSSYYYVNSGEWPKARQILVKLQSVVDSVPELKARVNELLARCYGHLGDVERQQDAYLQAIGASPQYLPARLGLITNLVNQGEIDRAIEEYRKLLGPFPQVCVPLARLLIARNQQHSNGEQNWGEVESLINQAAKSAQSVELVILQAELLLARGKASEAEAMLEQARPRFPNSVELWLASAEVLRRQRKFDAALALLDAAQKSSGDTVDLRLKRAGVLVTRGGIDVPKVLSDLTQNLASFSRNDRRRLLEILAVELARQNDLPQAARLWSEVAALDPNNLEPRLRLLDLAFQIGNKADIEPTIEEIKRIDGTDSLIGRYSEIRYLIWQAWTAADRTTRLMLRSKARSLLDELGSRRPDWSVIPRALAELQEQELVQTDLDAEAKKRKQGETANLYLQAIELGQRNLAVVRRATELLYASGRAAEVSQLWSKLPAASILASNLQHLAADVAVRNQDYDRALELARKAVETNPNDFRERLWLVQILIASGRRNDAETELRKGIDLTRTDPDRWIALVQFLLLTSQSEQAEQVVREAEVALPKDRAPLALARCCEALGQAYQTANRGDQAAKWYDAAKSWYKAAQAAQPDDSSIIRQLTEFLLRSGQLGEVESQLTAILNRTTDFKNTDDVAWARRTLALTLVARSDYQRARKALALVEPLARAGGSAGSGSKPSRRAEDLRVLARVYEAQKSVPYRKLAIEALEELAANNQASVEDRFLLAQMYNGGGEWTKAKEQYRTLLLQAESTRDPESLTRRPIYIARFASDLLDHHQSDQEQQELSEAQELIEKLKQIQPGSLGVLILEARTCKAQNQISKAVELIQTYVNRPNLPDVSRQVLAELAENLGQFDLAARLFQQLASQSNRPQDHLALIRFLGHRGRTKDALDMCEPLWSGTPNLEGLVTVSLEVLFSIGAKPPELDQINRVAGWMEKALERNPESSILMIGLGNLRERQGRYADAETLYRRAIQQGEGDVIALNNLAWLMALRDGQRSAALDLINRAIAFKGPLPEFLDTRGVVYLTSGQSQRAIDDLENAVAVDPSASKYFHLAQAYLEANKKEAAKQSLAKAHTKGLKPSSLHPLEVTAYQEVLSALETH